MPLLRAPVAAARRTGLRRHVLLPVLRRQRRQPATRAARRQPARRHTRPHRRRREHLVSAAILRGDARRLPLPDASVDLIVTSPPYFGLRSYTDGGQHYAGQIGSEATPGEWVAALVECTAEWVRVLKPEGSLFVNLGDKYSGNETGGALTAPGPGLHNSM